MRIKSLYALLLSLTAAALSAVGCASVQEMETVPPAGGTFEVYALPEATRTANDGLSTLWVEGDRFQLFHAPAGTAGYVADGAFTVDEPDTGHARGSVQSLGTGTNDWYLLYPYTSSETSPAALPVTVGAPSRAAQVQAGADNSSGLSGEAFPLSGRVSGVPVGEVPSIPVSPALSVVAVEVSNPGSVPVPVTQVRFLCPEPVVGAFTVDVTGPQPVFTAVDASSEAVLTVTGEALVPAGGKAVFYLGIKPFTAEEGKTLTLTVNGQERSVTLPRAFSFAPGKIKVLTFTLDPPVLKPFYFKRVTSVTPGRRYLLVANDTKAGNVLRLAHSLPAGTDVGRLDASDVTEEDGVITLYGTDSAFKFYSTDKGFTIAQSDGRYLCNNKTTSLYAGTGSGAGYYWSVSFDDDGLAEIRNSTRAIRYNMTSTVRKFVAYDGSSASFLPLRLYELQNDDEAIAEFLQNTLPGVYNYNAQNWLYADGTHQTAVRTGSDRIVFRLYEPSVHTAVQVAGIPADVKEGDRFTVRMSRYEKLLLTHCGEFVVSVVRVTDGQAWLLADGGTGFIVKIQ